MTPDPRPAYAAYRTHVETCEAAEHGRWCQACLDLDWDADVESRQRAARRTLAALGA